MKLPEKVNSSVKTMYKIFLDRHSNKQNNNKISGLSLMAKVEKGNSLSLKNFLPVEFPPNIY